MMSRGTDRREFLSRIAARSASLLVAGSALATDAEKKGGKGRKSGGRKGKAKESRQWKPLFNGTDLTGWKEMSSKPGQWKVVEGVLTCSGGGGGWLSTTEQYANYEIALEFQLPAGGNSGVFLRHSGEGDGAYTGMEIQALDDYAKMYDALQPWQYCGSLYGVVAAAPAVSKKDPKWQDRASKPPDASGKTPWQKLDILCAGRRVKVTLNDKPIVDANLDDHPDQFAKHPGLKRVAGYIGLQNHSTGVYYRNIMIRDPGPQEPAAK